MKLETIIDDIRSGKPIILTDDKSRENEGDMVLAAEKVGAENLAFLMKYTHGIICIPMLKDRLDELDLKLMTDNPTTQDSCKYTISVDSVHASKSGIGAHDKYLTIRTLLHGHAYDLRRPGHTFPLMANPKGLNARRGHTEGSIELMKIGRFYPAAVISEVVDMNSREPLNGERLEAFAREHKLRIISIEDIANYQRNKDLVTKHI